MSDIIKEQGNSFIEGEMRPDKTAYLSILYVPPNERRKGRGAGLYSEFEEEARRRGAHRIIAEFDPADDADIIEMRQFYKKRGFVFRSKEGIVTISKGLVQ